MYYVLVEDSTVRNNLISYLDGHGINAVFHYVPLHSSPVGSRLGRTGSEMKFTDSVSESIIRLPMWLGLDKLHYIVEKVISFYN